MWISTTCWLKPARCCYAYWRRTFGRSVAFEDIHSYHLGISLRLDPSELDEFMRRTHEPDQLSSIEPMPGAAETLAAWVESEL